MFFGGNYNGFSYFHPEQIKESELIPPVYITDIMINNTSVYSGDYSIPDTGLFEAEVIDKIYLKLPWNTEKVKEVADVVPFRRRRKLSLRDIFSAKKHIEDVFLDWDDFCLHHFVIDYEIDGVFYKDPPIGVWAKKIRLRSLLFTVKDKLRRETWAIFDNMERNFCGFISSVASSLSTSFDDRKHEAARAVINIGYETTHVVIMNQGNIRFFKEYSFGIRELTAELEKEFAVPFGLAQEILNRYVSFQQLPAYSMVSSGQGDKEISIKSGGSYFSLSTRSLNSFVKSVIKDRIFVILGDIKKEMPADNTTISIIGRLNRNTGFQNFLRGIIDYPLGVPHFAGSLASSSFGCLKYGVDRFLESSNQVKEPFLRRALKIYREYF